MASQYITVAKIGGLAAECVLNRFQNWRAARQPHDSTEWGPYQWPPSVRLEINDWITALYEHAHEPPVLFFAKYVDLWSYWLRSRFLEKFGLIEVFGDDHQAACFKLPFDEPVSKMLKRVSRYGPTDEDRLFATITLKAANSWDCYEPGGILVFVRYVVGGLVPDQDVRASLAVIPAWLKPTAASEHAATNERDARC